ncbi:hypothetical protein [Algimonas arctica]
MQHYLSRAIDHEGEARRADCRQRSKRHSQ